MIDNFDGRYAFLSNFYDAPVVDKNGTRWPTAEHAYQAMKTNDPNDKRIILQSTTPGIAKRMGMRIKMRTDWDAVKEEVMRKIVTAKFEQNPHLKAMLVATGDEVLLEGNNWHDNYWGDCACPKCQRHPGKNKLGRILMHIRDN